tara:strand:+ start:596 stop:1108 length:513 start_codon:yes stop_codon:yes gene_type:complete
MAKISNTTVYPNIIPTANDFVILTDVSDSDATKTCTVNDFQEYFGTKTLVVTLTPSEILNSFTAPVVLLTCNTGEYIQIINSAFFIDFNTTAYSVSANVYLTNNGDITSTQFAIIGLTTTVDLAGAVWEQAYNYPIAAGGNSITFQSQTGNPTLGDSPITFNILYRITKF